MTDREIFYKTAGGAVFGEFVSVSRFVVTQKVNNRLWLRCFNRGYRIVTGLEVAVFPLNNGAAGSKPLTFAFSELFGEPDREFALPDIPLPASWREVRVEILTAQSFDRTYDFRDGSAQYRATEVPRRVHKCDKTYAPLAKYAVLLSLLMLLLTAASVAFGLWSAGDRAGTVPAAYAENIGTEEETLKKPC